MTNILKVIILKRRIKVLKIFLVLVLLTIFVMVSIRVPLFNRIEFITFVEELENQESMGIAFICATVIGSVFFIPISWFKALGGIYFGVKHGFIFSLIAGVISCGATFFISRLLGRESILRLFDKYLKKKFWVKYRRYFEERESIDFTSIFLIRNAFFIPFSLTNYIFGVTDVSFAKYMLASFLGMIPGTFLYTYLFAKSLNIKENPIELIPPLVIVLIYFTISYKINNKMKLNEENAHY